MSVDDISLMVAALVRVGVAFRFVFCMVKLQGAEEEQSQYRKRAKHVVMFYVLAECIWQIKDLVFYYYR